MLMPHTHSTRVSLVSVLLLPLEPKRIWLKEMTSEMILLPMLDDANSSSTMAAEKRPMSCFLVSLMRCTRMSSFSISER